MLSSVAKQHSEIGAQAFAPYFFKAYGWGYQTNDPFLVEQVSASACTGCAKYVSGIRSVVSRKGTITGGRVSVRSVAQQVGSFRVKSDFVFTVVFDQDPIVVSYPGTPAKTAQPSVNRYSSLVYLSWVGGRWQVIEVNRS